MAKRHETKTNAVRMLDALGLNYQLHAVQATPEMTGVEIALSAGQDPDHVFKTLVTQDGTGEHFVFMVPVACELDLKKAARRAGVKSIQMVKARELFDLTGYVHGGCSPLGMKKPFPTFIDETCVLYDTILFSAGRIGAQIEMAYDELARALDFELCDLTVMP